jgi:hypothetical protein
MSDLELRFGAGRISGVLSAVLGGLSLLAVLCFRFPELLTTADLRAVYPVPLLRAVLFAALLLSLGFALASFVLSRRRSLGLIGILLTGAAVGMGGAWVEAEGPIDRTSALGLDWFILDLLVLALVFVPMERFFALRRDQLILRAGFRTDLAHFFASHLLVQVTVFLSMAPAAVFFRWAILPEFQSAVASQPLAIQLVEAVFLADLFQYGIPIGSFTPYPGCGASMRSTIRAVSSTGWPGPACISWISWPRVRSASFRSS